MKTRSTEAMKKETKNEAQLQLLPLPTWSYYGKTKTKSMKSTAAPCSTKKVTISISSFLLKKRQINNNRSRSRPSSLPPLQRPTLYQILRTSLLFILKTKGRVFGGWYFRQQCLVYSVYMWKWSCTCQCNSDWKAAYTNVAPVLVICVWESETPFAVLVMCVCESRCTPCKKKPAVMVRQPVCQICRMMCWRCTMWIWRLWFLWLLTSMDSQV